MKEHQQIVMHLIDNEYQEKIERVILFDQKIDDLNKIEIQFKSKVIHLE